MPPSPKDPPFIPSRCLLIVVGIGSALVAVISGIIALVT